MTTSTIVAPKKLIEVALPLDEINKAAAKEKSIRHGHPSTLHLWWARRPLAAARAVLFAQLVNDPSWKYSEEELKKNQIKGSITKKRNELFKLITELVQWENTTNEDVLERARKEIQNSWKETCEANKNHPHAKALFDPSRPPAFHDPFAGGGAIPLEAQRLGLETHASDLNPVAVLINKAMIEIPPRFASAPPVGPVGGSGSQTTAKAAEDWSGGRGLAEDVRRYGTWMREEAKRRIGHLYPEVEITKEMTKDRPDLLPFSRQKLTVVAWLWARTVKSPNPAFAERDVPLVSNFFIAAKPDKEAFVTPIVSGKTFRFVVTAGKPPKGAEGGTKLGKANFYCLFSRTPIDAKYIRNEAQAGRMGMRLMAVVAEAGRSRVYLSPDKSMEDLAYSAVPTWKPDLKVTTPCHDVDRLPMYGMYTWGDAFTARQLTALSTMCDLVPVVAEQCRKDCLQAGMGSDDRTLDGGGAGARAYSEAIATYLALAIDKLADYNSSLVVWSPTRDQAKTTFARNALPMVWDFAEVNPFAEAAGDLKVSVEGIVRTIVAAGRTAGYVQQASAQTQKISSEKIVSTDPPYYDNIGYADLSDFFYVWLRRSLRTIFASLFATLAVPKSEELVATPYRHGSKEAAEKFFLDGMTAALHGIATQSCRSFPVTIYYAFKQSETSGDAGTASTGWETFLSAVLRAGLGITGTWPIRTERESRSVGIGNNALASSIVLVCRPMTESAPSVARKDFLRQLERVLPPALAEMTADPEAAVAPVDLAQAAIGPGMAIFSKYDAVLEADGSPMSVHDALIHINKAIDGYFAHAEGDLDADTRFCIGWFQQRGFEAGPFGEADVLARAKGTAVDGVEEAGVLSASKGKVRLLRIKEYPEGWDPTKDSRLSIWEACHQMCRALGDSEHEAGVLLARMPQKQDAIRQLAYRLYTICERQKWAEEARGYNDLITSWPTIVEESHKVGHAGAQLELV